MNRFISSTRSPWRALLLVAFLFAGLASSTRAATRYVFATFKGDAAADEKLWIYTSSDAVNFSLLSATGYGGPTGVVRDPSIIKHTDGKYYVAHTVQSWTTKSTYFAIASSTNLTNWTPVATVNAGVTGTAYTWAPEFFVENGTVKIIVNLGDANFQFRPYIFTALNSTLTSWSGPVDMGIGTNHIDTFVVKSGTTYHAYVKNETTKYIEHATAGSLTGPWTWVGTGNWAGWGSGVEGPALVQLDSGQWRIYVDSYSTGGGIKTGTSSSLSSWTSLSAITVSPSSVVRHGTVLRETIPTVADGTYRLQNRANGLYLDNLGSTTNGAPVGQWTGSTSSNQKWQVTTVSGYRKLICATGAKRLDSLGHTGSGTTVGQWDDSTSTNQQWTIQDAGGGYYRVINRANGLCLDTGGATTNGATMQLVTSNTSSTQQWQFTAP
jgi:hypothetical protein